MQRAKEAVRSPRGTAAHLLSKAARAIAATSRDREAQRAIEGVVLERFYRDEVGRAHGLGRRQKEELVAGIQRVTAEIPSATSWLYHVVLAEEILSLPEGAPGDVIECGCWKGASTSSLSLVCRAAGRRLLVCDSFEGLPEDEPGVTHDYPHLSVYGFYQQGMYAGRLEEVKANIARCGDLSVCEFVPGFFSDTLSGLKGPLAFAFLDVDLTSSMRDCLKHIWPLLIEGGAVYTDDSCDMEVVRIWFDEEWWAREVGDRAPGYVGSGCGLPLDPGFSSLGYARKRGDAASEASGYHRVPWLYYPDAEAEARGLYFPPEKSS